MTQYKEGDQIQAICHTDGRVSATMQTRDVPFSDGSGVVHDILVATCDTCRAVIGIPAQSTPAIGQARSQQGA